MISLRKIKQGVFITFEGIDGCGKSTQAELARRFLMTERFSVRLLREPGSTVIAERLRRILLDKNLIIPDLTELLLYEAARSELVAKTIAPALAKKEIVLCDRFFDSTTAYQGFGRKLDIKTVRSLHKVATGGLVPDLTFLFDVDLKTASGRLTGTADRLESQSAGFFNRVRRGFLEVARKEHRRFRIVDGSQSTEQVFSIVRKHLCRKFDIR